MRRIKDERKNIACGLCSNSLQQATLGFGISDVLHGVVGAVILITFIIRKDVESAQPSASEKITGFTKPIIDLEFRTLYSLFGTFLLQILLGLVLSVGASKRSRLLCVIWMIFSILTSPISPVAYTLLLVGRIFEWVTVGEFIWEMANEKYM